MQISDSPSPEIYDSSKRGSVALEELRGIFKYRDLIYQLVRRDIVARYKRSFLGIAWTMVQPLGMMLILTVVFSQLFHQVKGYPVYVLSGLISWTFFSQATTSAIHQMVWGGSLLHRIYLPKTAFAISAIGTGLVNLLIGLIPLLLIAWIAGVPLRTSLFFLPVSIFFLTAFALGVGLILSTLAVSFPDVVEMYQVLLVGWMYLTPIIYPSDMLQGTYSRWIISLNPLYYLVETFRQPIYNGNIPDLPTLAIGGGISLLTLLMGWLYFSRKADRFAYHT